MSSRGFTVPAQITSTRPLVDGGMSINIHTSEITDEEKLAIIKYLNGVGWILFRENEVQEEEIPKEDSDLEPKTQSQRLRGVLYRNWEQSDIDCEFKDYYKTETERIINHYKNKLQL